jgi:putative transposase
MPKASFLGDALTSWVDPGADGVQEDLFSLVRKQLKFLLETALELELTAYLGCGHWARSPQRRGARNGCYTRDLQTGLGLLEALRVPRARRRGFQPSLFDRYRRRHRQLDAWIRTLFFLGISTRGVGEALELLLGFAPSATAVSEVVAQLDAQVKAFHRRELTDDYVYLFLDGVSMTVKELPHAVKCLVLVAYGITKEGRRELLDYRVVASESSTEWERFLASLYERGVKGQRLQLILTDGGKGVRASLPLVYGDVPHQLCWVHKLRNVASHLKAKQKKPCLSQARAIYQATSRRAARAAWEKWRQRWQEEAPEAVACLGRDLEALLTFLACPEAHHRRIRTTNYIERLFREVRRRTRLMGAFAHRASCDRMLYGVFTRINRNWSREPLAGFTHQG